MAKLMQLLTSSGANRVVDPSPLEPEVCIGHSSPSLFF